MKPDTIAKTLNLPPLEKTVDLEVKSSDYEDDFEYARGNLLNIIEKGAEALDGILDVAGQSQHPRSYEVAANLIKTMSEVNKDLLELSKRKQELTGESKSKTINNNLFVGSTAELQKLLKNNDSN
jgi:hypothetical protein